MIIKRKPLREFLPAAFLILSAAVFTLPALVGTSRSFGRALWNQSGQPGQSQSPNTTKTNTRPQQSIPTRPPAEETKPNEAVMYSYEFTQPAFYICHILVEHDAFGHGRITFERLNEEVPVEEAIEVSATALGRISALYDALNFLDSQTNYQSDKQFPHLGTIRIKMEQGTRKRVTEFNWTNNRQASALTNEYRRLADQAILVFDVSVARENQPLNAPKLMELLEILLKRDGLSDSHQLVPLLKQISTDERLPLIARNHALRLLKSIEKLPS